MKVLKLKEKKLKFKNNKRSRYRLSKTERIQESYCLIFYWKNTIPV